MAIEDPLKWFGVKDLNEFNTRVGPLLDDAARAIGMKRGRKKGLEAMKKIGSKSIYYLFYILEVWLATASDDEYVMYSDNIYKVLQELGSESPKEYVPEIKRLIEKTFEDHLFRTGEPLYILIRLLGDLGTMDDIEFLERLKSKFEDSSFFNKFIVEEATEAINNIKKRKGVVRPVKSKIKRFSKKNFLKNLSDASEAYINFLSRLGLEREMIEPHIDTIAYIFTHALYKDLCKIYSDLKARMVLEEHAIMEGTLTYFKRVLSDYDYFYDLVCKEIKKSKLPENIKNQLCAALRKISPNSNK